VVLDEGQVIKNPRTRVAQAVWQLSASHRWILSGTPIQNSVNDLYSYFRFLKWLPFDRQATFKAQVADIVKNNPEKGFPKLQHILQVLICACAVLNLNSAARWGGEEVFFLCKNKEQAHLTLCCAIKGSPLETVCSRHVTERCTPRVQT
jgi:hypothetical protein